MRNNLSVPNKNWRTKYYMMLLVGITIYFSISFVTTLAAPILPDPNLGTGIETSVGMEAPAGKGTEVNMSASVSIGNRVWLDSNGNGIQNADEAGVAGITVILFNADRTPNQVSNKRLGADGVGTDGVGNTVAQTITDNDGKYFFENVPPGNYQIQFDLDTLPEYHVVTQPNATNNWQPGSSERFDSDVDPITGLSDPTGLLQAGDEYYTLDLGILPIPAVEIGDTIWYDDDGDGLQSDDEDGVRGVSVTLFNVDGLPTVDLNGNLVEPMVTDRNGKYLFGHLPPGSYFVQFDLTTLPNGYTVNVPNPTNRQQPTTNSQQLTTNHQLVTGFLSAGSIIDNLDVGIVSPQPIEIGNRVWYDHDGDGIQDSPSDEPGVHGVEVLLFKVDGAPVSDMAGIPVGRKLTDGNGEYLFDNLHPGDYYVYFDLASLPPDYVVTEQNVTNDQSPTTSYQTDSDADPDSGRTPNTGFVPSGGANYDLDMGIHKPSLHLAGIDVAPTAIQLMSLTASETSSGVLIEWSTGAESTTFGFQILRSQSNDLESAALLTDEMVLANGDAGLYDFIDTTAQAGQVYSYWLVEVQNDETVYEYGPTEVAVAGLESVNEGFLLFLPLIEK